MKKIIKSGISILLCVVMLFGAAPLSGLTGALGEIADWIDRISLNMTASALECGDNVYWTLDETTGTLTISGEGDTSSALAFLRSEVSTVIIDYGVTSIYRGMFASYGGLVSVTIPDSVTSIGIGAFSGCKNLTSITIPDSVTSIGQLAFSSCTGLSDVVIPDSVTTIGSNAFSNVNSITYSENMKATGSPWGAKAVNAACSDDGIIYNDQSKTILMSCVTTKTGDIIIPDSVISINKGAFSKCSGLTGITIPDSVKSIGDSAFSNCTGLTGITIPDGVTSISNRMFYGCTGLTSVDIPDTVTNIGESAFEGCIGLTSIDIPDTVTNIGKSAFEGCTGLTSVDIPDTVTNIGGSAFYGCKGLTSIVVPDGVTSIGVTTFSNCKSLTSITISESVTFIGKGAFSSCTSLTKVNISSIEAWCRIEFYDETSNPLPLAHNLYLNNELVTDLVIPDSVTSIDSAFSRCTSLTSITIPNSVTSIDDNAFSKCANLTSIVIGSGVTSIGSDIFYGCENLSEIKVSSGNRTFDSRNNCNAIIETATNTLILGCKNTVVPDSITAIGANAFRNCTGLESITIPDSITSIGSGAFYGCTGLAKVNINSLEAWCRINFESNPLVYAHNLYLNDELITDLVIPDGISSIDYVFPGCTSLTSITIPESVTSIDSAFSGCTGLTSVVIPDTVTSIYGAFRDCTGLTSVTVPDSITSINSAFSRCTSLTSITIPESVTSIGSAFSGCTGLTSISIPDSVTNIDYEAFLNCTGLTKIIIGNGVTSIDNNAFSGCTNLTSIVIGSGVTSIGSDIFYGCENLSEIKVSSGNRTFDSRNNCNAIINTETNAVTVGCKNSVIPYGITRIETFAFLDCTGLTGITIPDSVTSIGAAAFSGCTGLTGITIPDSVTVIDENAFSGCKSLTSVTIPNSIKSIAWATFAQCKSLSNVTIPDSVIEISGRAFFGCMGLSITVPDSVTRIEELAFGNDPTLWRPGVANVNYHGTAAGAPWGARMLNGYVKDGLIYTNSTMKELVACQPVMSGELVIPDSVTIIYSYAFSNCFRLTSIIIPDSVKSINSYAFEGCTRLTNIAIPTSVTYIGELAFSGVNNIIYSDNWYNDVMHRQGSPWGAKAVDAYVEGNLYYYDSSKELLLGCSPDASGTVNIPDTVEEVGEKCFLGCDNIETLTFSSPVHFADTAVAGCDNLQSVVAPDNSDDFGIVYTKPVNGGISTASVSGSSISIEYDTGILFCKRNASGDYTVPSKITHICENAFANCKNVSVIIPDGVILKRIGANAFLNSKDYNDSAKWLNNVLVIGNYIVASKAELSGIYTVASAIKGVADRAFAGCSGMTGFNCGSGTRFLGSGVFSGCSSSLKDNLTFSSTESLEYIGGDIFDAENEKDYVKETTYCNNALISVSPDVESFTIEDGTTIIAEGAFEGCTNLKSITIPDSIKKINKDTFKGCISLSSVTLNANVDEIGDNAFADCMSLTEISIPASVKEIGHLAFYGCTGMRSFNVASGNEKYKSDDGILMSADGNTVIQYPAAKDGTEYSITSGKSVADLAFYRCRNLQKITLADNVTLGNRNPFAACIADFNNGKYVFGDAKKTILKSVSASVTGEFTVPYTVKEIGSDALRECTGITAVDFSNAYYLKKIGDNAFYGCTGLTDIIVPNTVTDIGTSAFENCLNLKTVEFTADKNSDINTKLVSIGDYAFCNCPCNATDGSCNSDILSAEKLEIGKNAFNNVFCDSVKLDSRGLIYGFNSGLDSLNSLINIDDDNVTVSCNTKTIGTGSVVTVTNGSEKSSYYNVVIFGDVNGDGWYDGTDAMIVSCLANGMLTKEDVSEAVYTAADCNHDGEINNDDVELLQQAGVLLVDIDQTKSKEELLETSSAYVEYLNLIDQTVEEDSAEITDVAPTPETAKTLFDILKEIVIKIINYIILNLSILKLR